MSTKIGLIRALLAAVISLLVTGTSFAQGGNPHFEGPQRSFRLDAQAGYPENAGATARVIVGHYDPDFAPFMEYRVSHLFCTGLFDGLPSNQFYAIYIKIGAENPRLLQIFNTSCNTSHGHINQVRFRDPDEYPALFNDPLEVEIYLETDGGGQGRLVFRGTHTLK